MRRKIEIIILIAWVIAAKASFDYVKRYETAGKKASLAALIESHTVMPFHLDPHVKASDCQTHNGLPDHACTPGAVFTAATQEQICIKGYTQSVRNVSVNLKKHVYTEYGLSYPQPRGAYEVDHLIPLELGGSNDIANLFPESAEPQPGFHEKDLVENYLNQEVCAGHLSLTAAQEQIATNWRVIYDNLTPDEITILKGQFRNNY